MILRLRVATCVCLMSVLLVNQRPVTATPLLAVDFGTAGVSPQPGFLELAGAVGQSTATTTLGGYTINLAGQGFGTAAASNAALVDQNVRGLYRDYYYNNSETPGEGVSLSIANVMPDQQYHLTLWSYDGDQGFYPTENTWGPKLGSNTSGGSGNVAFFNDPYPTTLAEYSTTIQVTSTSSTLEILGTTVAGATGGGTRLNGFRLNDGIADVLSVDLGKSVPPPSPLQSGFNGMSGNFPLGPNAPPPSLSSVFGAYTVTVSGDPYQASDYSRVGFEDTTAAAAIDPSIRALYQDALINNLDLNDGSGLNLSIQGVTPNTPYKLKLWSYNADNTIYSTPTSFGPRAGSNTTGTTGSVTQFATPLPTTLDDYSTTITVSSTSGTLDIHAASTDNYGGTRLNAFELSLAVETIPGDFNGSQSVNGADFSIWKTHFGTASGGSTATGDANGDHNVDGGDFLIWQQNFGRGPAVGVVPEPPSGIVLVIVGATAGMWRHRLLRRRQ